MIAEIVWVAAAGVLAQRRIAREEPQGCVPHIKNRQERVLSDDLMTMSVTQHMPLIRRHRYDGGRKAIAAMSRCCPNSMRLCASVHDASQAGGAVLMANARCVAGQRQIGWELRDDGVVLANHAPQDAVSSDTQRSGESSIWAVARSGGRKRQEREGEPADSSGANTCFRVRMENRCVMA
ncbi:MAG TPA: hypothetical protein VHP11_04020 [Tepidisphaeraceae bacterium]|nr:hypothetical protein [Tepidisphaeraceae bacterium]